MRTLEPTAISNELQEDLTKYGLVVKAAKKEAPINANKPNFFGVRNSGSEVELIFNGGEKVMTEPGVQVSVLAPDIEAFDMLVTTDFKEAVKKSDAKTIREYVSKLFDEIKL